MFIISGARLLKPNDFEEDRKFLTNFVFCFLWCCQSSLSSLINTLKFMYIFNTHGWKSVISGLYSVFTDTTVAAARHKSVCWVIDSINIHDKQTQIVKWHIATYKCMFLYSSDRKSLLTVTQFWKWRVIDRWVAWCYWLLLFIWLIWYEKIQRNWCSVSVLTSHI